MRVAVLTISDSVAKGEREDRSGPAVAAACRGLGWEVTVESAISDDPAGIRRFDCCFLANWQAICGGCGVG